MLCKNCGARIVDGDKFCRSCGTTITLEEGNSEYLFQDMSPTDTWGANSADWSSQPAPKKPKKKGKGKGLLIAGILAVLVIAVAAIALVLSLGNPTVKLASAMKASADAFGKAYDSLKLGQAQPMLKKDEISQSMEVEILSVDPEIYGSDMTALEGLGLRMELDVSLPQREMGLRVVPRLGSAELLEAAVSVEDARLALAIPQIFPDPAYGVNTETMIKDLERLGVYVGEFRDMRLNFIDMLETIRAWSEDNRIDKEKLAKANEELLKTVTVEKGEKTTLSVNGNDRKCVGYQVTIPRSGLKTWLRALEGMVGSADPADLVRELGNQMNVPREMLDELAAEVRSGQTGFDELYDALDELGDVELQVYIYSGKVAAVVYEDKIEGSKVEIGLYLGGDEEYVDAVTLEIAVDKEKLTLVSKGDHAAREGVFTDKTVITMPDKTKYTLETKFDPNSESDNLSVSFKDNYSQISVKGNLLDRKDILELDLSDMSLRVDGRTLLSMSMTYTLTDYTRRVDISNPNMLLEKDEAEIAETFNRIEEKATEWAIYMMIQYPELADFG